jgi:hypothetical protein
MQIPNIRNLTIGVILSSVLVSAQEEAIDLVEMSAFPVYAGSFLEGSAPAGQLSDRMAREVRVDLQSRGGVRYQTDISIRGGIFEGTGLSIGGLALFDPQTGHYFSEIPLDPAFFGGAQLLTGVENGIRGFNSTAGSIDWTWAPIATGGNTWFRLGTDSWYGAGVRQSGQAGEGRYEIGLSHEQGDGSIDFADFEMSRLSARYEQELGVGTLRLFGGYVDKFYGWPRMYTGFPLNETDHYAVSLVGWQWETGNQSNGSFHRIGGYWRQVDDDYEYTRESPNNFFEHKTKVLSLQGDGIVTLNTTRVVYRWTLVQDEILRSTSLVHGPFSERNYGEGALLAVQDFETDWGEWSAYGGFGIDASDEDSTVGLPQVGVSASGVSDGAYWKVYLEYSESSQVPGYTVLNSRTSGLFGGNPNLGRELAETLETGISYQMESVLAKLVLFQREDIGLVDWVYSSDTPSSRQAAPVDMTVRGLEGFVRWEHDSTAVELGFSLLDKDENYRESNIDASYYALNYARQRLLATIEQQLSDDIVLRLEGEYREHPDNTLRSGGDEALLVHLELIWKDFLSEDWSLAIRATNLGKEDFQSIPGTPAPGREGAMTLSYRW